mmetsp:Transcript_27627/g.71503  ORF Transcript_27627/g.71503 Transcript_27627/m.71503 type:complete len:247 (+) Transcript_27627:806-1546(+)
MALRASLISVWSGSFINERTAAAALASSHRVCQRGAAPSRASGAAALVRFASIACLLRELSVSCTGSSSSTTSATSPGSSSTTPRTHRWQPSVSAHASNTAPNPISSRRGCSAPSTQSQLVAARQSSTSARAVSASNEWASLTAPRTVASLRSKPRGRNRPRHRGAVPELKRPWARSTHTIEACAAHLRLIAFDASSLGLIRHIVRNMSTSPRDAASTKAAHLRARCGPFITPVKAGSAFAAFRLR